MDELDILLWIQGASPWMDGPMQAVSAVTAHSACWIAMAVLLMLSKRGRATGTSMMLAMVLVLIIVDLAAKPLVGRDRPFEVYDFPLIVGAPSSYSFPSGHSAYAFACAACIAMGCRRWAVPALAAATVVAYSRLYLFVHWPTDVLAGALLGILIGVAAVRVVRRADARSRCRSSTRCPRCRCLCGACRRSRRRTPRRRTRR